MQAELLKQKEAAAKAENDKKIAQIAYMKEHAKREAIEAEAKEHKKAEEEMAKKSLEAQKQA